MVNIEYGKCLDVLDSKLITISSMNGAIGSLIFIFVKSFFLTVPFFLIMAIGLFAWFPRQVDRQNTDMAVKAKTNIIKIQVFLTIITFITVAWLVAKDVKIY
jgi:uncharacterized membrane protein